MDRRLYRNIITTIRRHKGLSKDCLELVKQSFPNVNQDALHSLVCLEYQKRMKVNHSKSPLKINKYWSLYSEAVEKCERPGIILRISKEFDVCPCLIAKIILQKYFDELEGQEQKINDYLRDTSLIPDKGLAYEVLLCTLYDDMYSPLAETIKHSTGQQYEIKLHNEAVKLGLAFKTEEDLRKYGYDKTPDIKLEVPIAVDGFVINWIESKAMFGDEEIHAEYMKNQYLSYWNRFGPGLVIYWFGYPETIIQNGDKRFIIRDHLPANVIILSKLTT